MKPKHYYEVHYAIPSITMVGTPHWYVLCRNDVLKYVSTGLNYDTPSIKFDSESSALQSVTSTDILTEYRIVKCEYEF